VTEDSFIHFIPMADLSQLEADKKRRN